MRDQHAIAIVGGGVSGSLTALQLVRRGAPSRVVLIDPAPKPGPGLAYSTPSVEHLLNVPAAKISAFPDEPDHFLEWLRAHHYKFFPPDEFAPRAVFGRYIQSLIEGATGIEHIQSTVLDCWLVGEQAELKLANGARLKADAVVLAIGNFPSVELPGIGQTAKDSGVYVNSPWDEAACAGLAEGAPVTLIGSGLTAVDALLRLRELKHCGRITMMSRNGVLPHGHAPCEPLDCCVIGCEAPRRARDLLASVHRAIHNGLPWRAVVDSLRTRTNELWLALPIEEQRRFRRHLQRRWEVVRHRMAPAVASRVENELAAGSLELAPGRLLALEQRGSSGEVKIRTKSGAIRTWTADRVINCTGPNMDYTRVGSPVLNSLFEQGLITAGPLHHYLWSNENGALRAADGTFSRVLFQVGPGRQGTLLESIAVPELRVQAAEMAEFLATASSVSSQLLTIDHDRLN